MVSGMSVKPLKGDAVLFWSMVSLASQFFPSYKDVGVHSGHRVDFGLGFSSRF